MKLLFVEQDFIKFGGKLGYENIQNFSSVSLKLCLFGKKTRDRSILIVVFIQQLNNGSKPVLNLTGSMQVKSHLFTRFATNNFHLPAKVD